ncbi:unnamed protein product [Prorocentrum cordatum]|uniref:Uncharacterized protein n=1 Tax=Prorocentrum cordatum TaxID=2364126 RepID=A0ABN9QUG6_9DINO|nr:unnamed protein product [Polarella glacialis]
MVVELALLSTASSGPTATGKKPSVAAAKAVAKAGAPARPRTRSPSRPRERIRSPSRPRERTRSPSRPPEHAVAKADVVRKVSQPNAEAGKEARRGGDDADVKVENVKEEKVKEETVKVEDDSNRRKELDALESSLDMVHQDSDAQMKRMMELQRSMDELRKSMEDRPPKP